MATIESRLSKITVLVVDADVAMRMLIKDALKVLGFSKILIASDGESAIKEMQSEKVHIIFCDWVMHPMDGIAFTRRVRDGGVSLAYRTVPIIMLTGKSELHDVALARDIGVTEYLVKPFTIQQFCSRISFIVESPRDFVISPVYKGPDRRRKRADDYSGTEKRKNKSKKAKAS